MDRISRQLHFSCNSKHHHGCILCMAADCVKRKEKMVKEKTQAKLNEIHSIFGHHNLVSVSHFF